MKFSNQKATSLLLTLLVMAALLAIAIGVARLSIGEIKLLRDIPSSLIAYYAAESGMEKALYEEWQSSGAQDYSDCSIVLANGSYYGTNVTRQGNNITITTTGCYQNTVRAIEVSF